MFARDSWRHTLAAVGLLLGLSFHASAADLIVHDGTREVVVNTAALLDWPDRVEIEVEGDVAYGGTKRYQAVPLAVLLAGFPTDDPDARLEAVATDGFAAQIPLAAARGTGTDAARAWLAIEAPDSVWPVLPGKTASAGPYYIVWERPSSSGISRKFWAYQVAVLRYAASPERRWPDMRLDSSLPEDHPARVGQKVFGALCMPCHRINGAGSASMGPDMNQPMNPVEYFQMPALRRFIRNPASVRTWPDQKMPGFSAEQLSDTQLEGLIAYLERIARQRIDR